jgi:formylglycine-generating enzyme required for sulfatase activity
VAVFLFGSWYVRNALWWHHFFIIVKCTSMNAPLTISDYIKQLRDIPAGQYQMGRGYVTADRKGRYADELPPHLVSISAFRMGTTPVTVGMWREYTAANRKLRMPAAPEWGWLDDHPVVNVNWLDIVGKKGKGGYLA